MPMVVKSSGHPASHINCGFWGGHEVARRRARTLPLCRGRQVLTVLAAVAYRANKYPIRPALLVTASILIAVLGATLAQLLSRFQLLFRLPAVPALLLSCHVPSSLSDRILPQLTSLLFLCQRLTPSLQRLLLVLNIFQFQRQNF